jgi:nucleotide-binding universal stress UspA family protein
MFSKILVPLDGSQLAEQVLPCVQSLAQHTRAAIILLRVADHPARQYYVEGLAVNATQSDDSRTHCEAYLHRIAESLNNTDILVNYVVKEGAIADVILDYANAIQADLIAMSTHGRTGIGRWLLGSVATRIVRASAVPVLLVRPEQA